MIVAPAPLASVHLPAAARVERDCSREFLMWLRDATSSQMDARFRMYSSIRDRPCVKSGDEC